LLNIPSFSQKISGVKLVVIASRDFGLF